MAAWSAPPGIPTPTFGIGELAGAPTHFVDNSHPRATDFLNHYGSPSAPRLSVPDVLPAGSVVEVRGGPYFIGDVTWTLNGTGSRPVFVRGPSQDARPVFQGGDLRLEGSYFIVENIEVTAPDGDNNGRVRFDGSNTHHATLRFSYVHDAPGATGAGILNHSGDDVVIYANEIARIGIIPDRRDVHGLWTGCGTERVWVLDNHIHHNGGDAIQFGHGCWHSPPGPASVYIGHNHLHADEENGIDIKETVGPVVISQNTIHGYRPGRFSGIGEAIRINDEGAQGEIWVLFNRAYDSSACVQPERSKSTGIFVVGNVLHDCAIGVGRGAHFVVGNTIVGTQAGIEGGEAVDNLVTEAAVGVAKGVTRCQRNLLWRAPVGRGASCVETISADPLLAMNGPVPVGLQAGSPAIDAAREAHAVYDRYRSAYGIDIRVDAAGRPRPQGLAWDLGAHEVEVPR